VLYGITDNLALLFNIPVATSYRDGSAYARGLGDLYLQLEYAFWSKDHDTSSDMATVVGSIIAPSGSTSGAVSIGSGGPSIFLGTTYSHMGLYWYYYGAVGGVITTKHATQYGTQDGNSVTYQWGVGRNIGNPFGGIAMCILEFTGEYAKQDTVNGRIDKNSGSNSLYVGPSFWFSTPRTISQFGIVFPIVQQLNGQQRSTDYWLSFDFGWKFH
jgi:hypothetical protein